MASGSGPLPHPTTTLALCAVTVPFLRDMASPEYAVWRINLIDDRHSKETLRNAYLALYSRLQAALDLGERQKEFINSVNSKPPGIDILERLCATANKEADDWLGAIESVEKWSNYINYVYLRIWPLFPDVHENDQTSGILFQRVDELHRLWETVARNAAGYTFAHGLPADTGKVEDLQHWVNAAPREFEKEVAALFTPRPTTRIETLEKIKNLIAGGSNECAHPRELATKMRNEATAAWEESLRGISNLQALAPVTVVSWSAILAHFAFLVKPRSGGEETEKRKLREKLDDALMRLEMLKGTTGGGPQRYSVPLFDTCFTDIRSWNTWRNQALA